MEIIAPTLQEAVNYLNKKRDNNFQIEGNQVIEYIEEDSIYWSYETKTHSISGKKIYSFFC